MPAEPIRLHPIDRAAATPRRRPDPFTPPAGLPPSRPIAKAEEGERTGEGMAVVGSSLVIMAIAALFAWVLHLAFA
jgi:hypothetical protein